MPNVSKQRSALFAALLFSVTPMASYATSAPAPAVSEKAEIERRVATAKQLQATLKRETGTISLPSAQAQLALGDDYYFVGPEQSRTILVDIWANPPEAATGVLGMVFPKGKSFVDDSWSAVITFEDTGYVSDEDAKTIDYTEMLSNMKAASAEVAERDRANGYPGGILQGWAQPPTYDAARHSLVWARDIKFDGSREDTLNYDIRLLGRSGVLSMNILASMSQLDQVRAAAKNFASVGSFQSGARYADYNPATDRKAEYGIAGLVAAGTGVAVAKKVGLLAVILKFGKFIVIGLIAAFGAFGGAIRRLFSRTPAEEPESWADYGSEAGQDDQDRTPST